MTYSLSLTRLNLPCRCHHPIRGPSCPVLVTITSPNDETPVRGSFLYQKDGEYHAEKLGRALGYGNSKQIDRENCARCARASLAKLKANEVGVDACSKSLGVKSCASPALGTASFARYSDRPAGGDELISLII
jgi:hypothetical protein